MMERYVMPCPTGVTRLIQPAGKNGRPIRWTDGVAVRLPFRRLLLWVRS